MEKAILIQYISLKAEIADLEQRIDANRKRIERMENSGCQVSDSVKGTRLDGTYGSIRITGYPYQSCERTKKLLKQRETKLNGFRDKLLEIVNDVDDYINSLEDSRIRRMLRYKYFDNLTWIQVAYRMGGDHTAESCRKQIERFLEPN